jgi:hypothetical protein
MIEENKQNPLEQLATAVMRSLVPTVRTLPVRRGVVMRDSTDGSCGISDSYGKRYVRDFGGQLRRVRE